LVQGSLLILCINKRRGNELVVLDRNGSVPVVEFPDIQIDIETTGLRPDRCAIIQIGAVKFNYENETVDGGFFNRSMHMPPHRYWDPETRVWWSKRQDVYEDIMRRAEDPRTVMQDFADWVGYGHSEPLRFWAKPISFDSAFIESYLHDYSIPSPFSHRHATDLMSFIKGARGNMDVNSVYRECPMEGTAHNALFDALYQIKLVFYVKSTLSKVTKDA